MNCANRSRATSPQPARSSELSETAHANGRNVCSCLIASAKLARRNVPSMSITYLEAIREAQAKALREDPRVYIYGQDVGAFGGAFKATKHLQQEFPGRVIDSPISEDAMVGSAVG